MSCGLGEAASIVGIIAAGAKAFDVCIKGFTLLRTAQHAGRDLSTVHAMLLIQQQTIQNWAANVGLFEHPPQLNLRISDVNIVSTGLEQLAEVLSDLRKLKAKYKLHLEETSEELTELEVSGTSEGPPETFRSQHHRFRTQAAKVFHRRQGAWRKLRWAGADEMAARGLLQDVDFFVRNLGDSLNRSERDELSNDIQLMRRALIANTSDGEQLSYFGLPSNRSPDDVNLHAAAQLKQKLMAISHDSDSRDHNGINGNGLELLPWKRHRNSGSDGTSKLRFHSDHSMRISKTHVRSLPFSLELGRQLAYKDQSIVLIEWRKVDHVSSHEAISRTEQVCQLLHALNHPSFHSLQCVGYLEDQQLRRHGFVFLVPDMIDRTLPPERRSFDDHGNHTGLPMVEKSLHEMIRRRKCPSLNRRVGIAIILLETVLQLHTSGWLHKGIQSSNMVMFEPLEIETDVRNDFDDGIFYLGGYTQTRSDDPGDMTEPSPAQLEAQLYRHPQSIGVNRSRYRRSFDLFSVGCVLLELGTWSQLSKLLLGGTTCDASEGQNGTACDTQDTTARLLSAHRELVSHIGNLKNQAGSIPSRGVAKNVIDRLRAAMGDVYTEIAISCFRGINQAIVGRQRSDGASSENSEHEIIQLEHWCLGKLKQIQANI